MLPTWGPRPVLTPLQTLWRWLTTRKQPLAGAWEHSHQNTWVAHSYWSLWKEWIISLLSVVSVSCIKHNTVIVQLLVLSISTLYMSLTFKDLRQQQTYNQYYTFFSIHNVQVMQSVAQWAWFDDMRTPIWEPSGWIYSRYQHWFQPGPWRWWSFQKTWQLCWSSLGVNSASRRYYSTA